MFPALLVSHPTFPAGEVPAQPRAHHLQPLLRAVRGLLEEEPGEAEREAAGAGGGEDDVLALRPAPRPRPRPRPRQPGGLQLELCGRHHLLARGRGRGCSGAGDVVFEVSIVTVIVVVVLTAMVAVAVLAVMIVAGVLIVIVAVAVLIVIVALIDLHWSKVIKYYADDLPKRLKRKEKDAKLA